MVGRERELRVGRELGPVGASSLVLVPLPDLVHPQEVLPHICPKALLRKLKHIFLLPSVPPKSRIELQVPACLLC